MDERRGGGDATAATDVTTRWVYCQTPHSRHHKHNPSHPLWLAKRKGMVSQQTVVRRVRGVRAGPRKTHPAPLQLCSPCISAEVIAECSMSSCHPFVDILGNRGNVSAPCQRLPAQLCHTHKRLSGFLHALFYLLSLPDQWAQRLFLNTCTLHCSNTRLHMYCVRTGVATRLR